MVLIDSNGYDTFMDGLSIIWIVYSIEDRWSVFLFRKRSTWLLKALCFT